MLSSADYVFLDRAMKSLWKPFHDLVAEMDAFAPRPITDFAEDRRVELERLMSLNPKATAEELAREIVDPMFDFAASPGTQFSEAFGDRFMNLYVTVALLSHALCEAAINSILARGLMNAGADELFAIIEKGKMMQKWRVGPKSFFPKYQLPAGTSLCETLSELTKRRNTLVHYKVNLEAEGRKVKGSKFEPLEFQDGVRWVKRFFSLPYDLVAYAAAQLPDPFTRMFFLRDEVAIADEHKGQVPIHHVQKA